MSFLVDFRFSLDVVFGSNCPGGGAHGGDSLILASCFFQFHQARRKPKEDRGVSLVRPGDFAMWFQSACGIPHAGHTVRHPRAPWCVLGTRGAQRELAQGSATLTGLDSQRDTKGTSDT
ncbi:hypothetical protein L484_006850 [Morus notabilis]|uniref:Uncharacterized protein n=1 Tax=Morus notabilis TaxID=981085 RepID=W9QXQ3_9ROSA|nr:hypothetical protein L484_006850 [Morus notabilis]